MHRNIMQDGVYCTYRRLLEIFLCVSISHSLRNGGASQNHTGHYRPHNGACHNSA